MFVCDRRQPSVSYYCHVCVCLCVCSWTCMHSYWIYRLEYVLRLVYCSCSVRDRSDKMWPFHGQFAQWHTHTLMETHHSFAAHGPAEIREKGKGRNSAHEENRAERQEKEKKKKKERHLLKVVFHLTDLMFLPWGSRREKRKPCVSCWINRSAITIPLKLMHSKKRHWIKRWEWFWSRSKNVNQVQLYVYLYCSLKPKAVISLLKHT